MTFSVWLEPIPQDAKYLRKIIGHLAKKYGAPTFTPHVTLYSGIGKYLQAEEAVKKCTGFPKLRLQTKNIAFSNYLWKTLFVNIKQDDNMRLVNKCLRNSLEHSTRYEFKPHISLIYKKMDAKTKYHLSKTIKIKQSFTFDKITIISSSKNIRKWKKRKTIQLKKTRSRALLK